MRSLLKSCFFIVLAVLPFQRLPQTLWSNLSGQQDMPFVIESLSLIDEFTFLILLFLAFTFVLIKPNSYGFAKHPANKWILGFVAAGGASMAVNKVPALQGVLGTYDVLKNLMVLYLFLTLRLERDYLFKSVDVIKYAIVVLAVFGIAFEVLALLFETGIGVFVASAKRYGLYRINSLAGNGNWNYLGVYGTLGFFMVYIKEKKSGMDYAFLALTLAMIGLTISRQVFAGFIVLFLHLNRKFLPVAAIVTVLALVLMLPFYEFFIEAALSGMSLDPENYYRLFALIEAVNIFMAKPLLGAGPGMYGGVVSITFKSPIYDSWPDYFRQYAYTVHGIDQFWFSVLAESGAAGFLMYALIFYSIYRSLRKASDFFKSARETEMSRTGMVLSGYIFSIVLMGFGGGLNSAFVVFTYFAMCGIYLSIYNSALKGGRPA